MNPLQIYDNVFVIRNGNIFNADTEAIVNPVNIVGVCGTGLAKTFKDKYPDNYAAYKDACNNKIISIGETFTFHLETRSNPKYIINFPTKKHWKDPSLLYYIESGLKGMIIDMKIHKISSVALPKIGCGIHTGQLNWNDVKPFVIETFKKHPTLNCYICE